MYVSFFLNQVPKIHQLIDDILVHREEHQVRLKCNCLVAIRPTIIEKYIEKITPKTAWAVFSAASIGIFHRP